MKGTPRQIQEGRQRLFDAIGNVTEALTDLVGLEDQWEVDIWQWVREDHMTVQAQHIGINELRFAIQVPADTIVATMAAYEAEKPGSNGGTH